ncbi:substrate-binding domain-containing protein [Arthrobacter sp. Y81]|uniref:substrate-binding domain-containing protein n=1 Tax=Arthrobacter sp. Y81 TaxID=2058897 RepID=UPI000CE2ED54|nr:substrate-binding domain-containing protein [Arthrobacter sp. Y81]
MKSLGIRNITPSPDETAAQVSADFASGPRLQAEYLLGLGSQRLGYVHPADPGLAEFIKARLQLVNEVCVEAGVPRPIVREVQYQDGSGHAATAAWKQAGVTAVIAYNDETAADVIAGAVRTGIRVPEDLSVVGHDNSPLAARFMPSLSSVAVDMERLRLYMAGIALHLAEGHPLPEPPSGATSLVRRESAVPL